MFGFSADGYIRDYLYAGKKEAKFDTGKVTGQHEKNQLVFERNIRKTMTIPNTESPDQEISPGVLSSLGMPWKYYYSYGNIFLDKSTFYHELHEVELVSAVQLIAAETLETELRLWSYDAMTLWVNGEIAGGIETPVYKPVSNKTVKVQLQKGVNNLFVKVKTLGVRDTRVGFAIQVLNQREKLSVSLPGTNHQAFDSAREILDRAQMCNGTLNVMAALPQGSCLLYHTGSCDFYKQEESFIQQVVAGETDISLEPYETFALHIPVGDDVLCRRFEQTSVGSLAPIAATETVSEIVRSKHITTILNKIAAVRSITRSKTDGFSLYPVIARLLLGATTVSQEEEVLITIKQIERRLDCSDFMTCALIRLMKRYQWSDELNKEIRRVMLSFRYWMDEEGQDGMCFWSENHSLMFYQTAYFFGLEYPEDHFVRAGKTGAELADWARERLNEWLTDVNETGFDEFNSGCYGVITLMALLNLVDFAEADLAKPAGETADLLIRTVAIHCFHNVMISPQGRVYRDALAPQKQSIQGLLCYLSPEAPYAFNEWVAVLADSNYEIPADAAERMEKEGIFSYQTSNAVIDICKTENYMLTSVRSPRRDGIKRIWEHEDTDTYCSTFAFTKSLNECFHGTMQFEPGVFGYQQHLWSAALSPELVVFANYPGTTCEDMAESRPGYWHGNGVMPALRQVQNVLGAVYVLPQTLPVQFTHIYWNEAGFDERKDEAGWLFGRHGDSYIALWCNQPMTDYDDMLFGCEKRSYGSQIAYLCVMGERPAQGDFETFVEACLKRKVTFDETNSTLKCQEFELAFVACDNETQYVR